MAQEPKYFRVRGEFVWLQHSVVFLASYLQTRMLLESKPLGEFNLHASVMHNVDCRAGHNVYALVKANADVQWDNFMVFRVFLFFHFSLDILVHWAWHDTDSPLLIALKRPALNNWWGNQFYFNRSILSPRPCYQNITDFWQSFRWRRFFYSISGPRFPLL